MSFLSFIVSFIVVSNLDNNTHYALFSEIFKNKTFYIVLMLIICTCYFIDSLFNINLKILLFSDLKVDLSEIK